MRRHFGCIDNKTGYELIVSECSYNHVCMWLARELQPSHIEIVTCTVLKNGLIEIKTQPTKLEFDADEMLNGKIIGKSSPRTFYYDEERGYLLGE